MSAFYQKNVEKTLAFFWITMSRIFHDFPVLVQYSKFLLSEVRRRTENLERWETSKCRISFFYYSKAIQRREVAGYWSSILVHYVYVSTYVRIYVYMYIAFILISTYESLIKVDAIQFPMNFPMCLRLHMWNIEKSEDIYIYTYVDR